MDQINRRRFLNHTLKGVSFFAAYPVLQACSSGKSPSIEKIELYRYDINIPRHFSWGTWHNRQQIFMKVTAGDYFGWGEVSGSTNNPELDLRKWGKFLGDFKGLEISQALEQVHTQQNEQMVLDKDKLEFLEMTLLDIQGKIEERPAIELLGMNKRDAVPGLFCILEKDMDKVAERTHLCMDLNLDSHVKYKMYGDQEVDLEIIKLARSILSDASFVLSDANRGYKNWNSVDELAVILKGLHAEGLNAMEDPAEMTREQWIELQTKVGDLGLVPDYPLRPAWKGPEQISAGMGRTYNMHPESMGSLHHLSRLSEKIRSIGGGIMIGDASLVGPACSVWQQIAIGVGASWVEAIEKPEESDQYLECLKFKPTFRDDKGHFAAKMKPGFGVDIDTGLLQKVCSHYVDL